MADATKTVAIIFKGTDQVSQALAPIESSLGGIGEDADFAAQGVGTLNDEVQGLGGAPAQAVDKLNTALKALAVGLIVDRFIDANVEAQRFQKTIEFATGSSAAAAQEWEYVIEVANRFGLELGATASAYSKFIASTSGSVLTTQELKTTFEGVAGTLSLVGASTQDVEEALRQMSQGIGKNRFELEDLKSIAERVPGGMYAIADALGVTTAELYKQITAGEFGAEQIKIYADSLNEGLNGVSFDTFENALARLKNTITETFTDIGQAGGLTALTKSIEGISLIVIGAIGSFELLGTRIGLVLGALATGDWTLGSDEFQESWESAVADVAGNIQDARDKFLDFGTGADGAVEPLSNVNDQLQEIVVQSQRIGVLEPLDVLGKSATKASAEIEKTIVQLEKIASDERIANIEATISLNIADIEANAKVAVANIESVAETIVATTESLSSLFGSLNDADTFRKQFLIEDQIELQNERLDAQFKLQEKLANSTINLNNAKAAALRNGSSLITVNGDGLQPHLEAFMFEILSAIQVRVNAQGYELLLGA